MQIDTVRAAVDTQLRREVGPSSDSGAVERTARYTRQIGSGPLGWSGVVWSDLDETTADGVITAAVGWFRAAEGHAEWKLYHHDLPVDLPRRLAAAGLVAGPVEAVMVAEANAVPDFAPPAGVRLVDVTDDAGVDMVVHVEEAAFEEDSGTLGARLRAGLAHSARDLEVVLAMAGDEPVSAARTDYRPGTDFAGLYGGGTVQAWRGQGVYRSLVGYRARKARERGVRYLQVDALPTSRPVLERVGFTCVALTTPYTLPG
ncbi:GNAT family N-acetyltransferase [Actinokineospora inagensis]|uniref:GNAT family N-acetyltransferase n=1 Tax=Actinokineospora inagensis TaxID=103730 RepID=UPI0004234BB5|nr:GNAT family N-acetyltransferase [Actinokineospora inagensis]